MQWTHEDVMIYMDKNTDDQIYIIDKKETKAGRTRQQEKTYYKIFAAISVFESSKWPTVSVQEVKMYMLGWCFGTHKIKLSKSEMEVPNKSETSKLTKQDWIFLIDTLLLYCKVKKIPVVIEWPEIQWLYNTYN